MFCNLLSESEFRCNILAVNLCIWRPLLLLSNQHNCLVVFIVFIKRQFIIKTRPKECGARSSPHWWWYKVTPRTEHGFRCFGGLPYIYIFWIALCLWVLFFHPVFMGEFTQCACFSGVTLCLWVLSLLVHIAIVTSTSEISLRRILLRSLSFTIRLFGTSALVVYQSIETVQGSSQWIISSRKKFKKKKQPPGFISVQCLRLPE